MPKRLGVFGGSFNPVHTGHLVAAINARHAASLDTVLMMVANEPWQKAGGPPMIPAATRYEAVAAAVAGHAGLEASRLEIDRGGLTYTIDTLTQLRKMEPAADLFLVLGNDAAAGLESWKSASEIAALAGVVVVNRPGSAPPVLGAHWRVTHVEIPALEVSSTDLRNRLIDGRPLDFLVPDAAIEVLRGAF